MRYTVRRLVIAVIVFALVISMSGCTGGSSDLTAATAAPATDVPTPDDSVPTEAPDYSDARRPDLTIETMPIIDGSAVTLPLAAEICKDLLNTDESTAKTMVQVSGTARSYINLMDGKKDLLIAYDCDDDVLAEKEKRGFEWRKEAVAADAFVFVVNMNNPVDSITLDQARDIYAGRITNWSQIGGDNVGIAALQRDQGVYSQYLMNKLVMNGTPMADASSGLIFGDINSLASAVGSDDGSAGAIGYTLLYYAEDMKISQGLKVLAIDGVKPTFDTVRSGEYPLLTSICVVTAADQPQDSPANQVFDWILSAEGQKIVAGTGFISVADTGTDVGDIYRTVGSRRYDHTVMDLITADDYGTLVPFVGNVVMKITSSSSATAADSYAKMYGLMTLKGEIVVDPVYSDVRTAFYGDNVPVYVLTKRLTDADGKPCDRLALAALDGSWSTGFDYYNCLGTEFGALMVAWDHFDAFDTQGNRLYSVNREQMDIDIDLMETLRLGIDDEPVGMYREEYLSVSESDGNLRCYRFSTGKTVNLSFEEWDNLLQVRDRGDYTPPFEESYPLEDDILEDGAPVVWCHLGRFYYFADRDHVPDNLFINEEEYLAGGEICLKAGLLERFTPMLEEFYNLDTMECVLRIHLDSASDALISNNKE